MLRYVRLYALISPGWWVHEFVRSMCLCVYVCMYVRMCYTVRCWDLDLLTRYQQTPKLLIVTVPTWQ